MTGPGDSVPLTSFQISAERAVRELLASRGHEITSRIEGMMEAPFYNPGDPLPVLRLQGPDVDIWLHENEMGFAVRGTEFFAEAEDYVESNALLDEALGALKKALD